jgi:uncharacterized protein (DUF433 family)
MQDHPFVEETPGIGGGYPQVRGTRTPIRVIVELLRATGDFERTAEMLPHLSREQVRGALDYYASYPDRVDEDIALNASARAELQGRAWPG